MTVTNFLGIPVEGEIDHTSQGNNVPQQPLTELQPHLMALLQDPRVKGIRWEQFTPYFMDGDPCIFGVRRTAFLLEGIGPEDTEYDGWVVWDDSYGNSEVVWTVLGGVRWRDSNNDVIPLGQRKYTGPDQVFYEQLEHFDTLLSQGAFNSALYEKFGDHAQVLVTQTVVTVDTFEHD